MSNIFAIHHSSVIVQDVQRSLDFYCGVLGMEQAERPEMSFPGAWICVGEQQQIHLLQLDNPDPAERPEHGGRDRHTAFHVADLAALIRQLEDNEIEHTVSRSGRRALFCRDPDGNTLEFIESNPTA